MSAAARWDDAAEITLTLGDAGPARQPTCAVRLVDRRTGQTHRINGSPLVLITRAPEAAVAELLAGRDPAVWEARIDQIGPGARPGPTR